VVTRWRGEDQDGVAYLSGHEYISASEAHAQAVALQDELEDRADIMVLDDLELAAFMMPDPAAG